MARRFRPLPVLSACVPPAIAERVDALVIERRRSDPYSPWTRSKVLVELIERGLAGERAA